MLKYHKSEQRSRGQCVVMDTGTVSAVIQLTSKLHYLTLMALDVTHSCFGVTTLTILKLLKC